MSIKSCAALADLVRIKFDLIVPGLGCMSEILAEIQEEHPVTKSDHAELCELAEVIERASEKFGAIVSRVSGVTLGDVLLASDAPDAPSEPSDEPWAHLKKWEPNKPKH